MNARLQTTIDVINKQTWTNDVNVEDIKFRCTKNGANRRIEVKFEGDNYYSWIRVFKDRTNELQTSLPTYFMGDRNETKKRIMEYLFMRYWFWLKAADATYTALRKKFDYSVEDALNVLGDAFERQFEGEYSFESLLMFYRHDARENVYKFSYYIELPDDYHYSQKTYEELKNTNPIITF